jgi:hypothetical protein
MARTSAEDTARIVVEKGIVRGKPRVLVGADAHALHQFARLGGARYQDVVAAVARRGRPSKKR